MDSNRQRFWQLADREDWPGLVGATAVEYDSGCRRLRLRDRSPAQVQPGTLDAALQSTWLATPAMTRDAFGTRAFWDPASRSVMANGAAGPAAPAVPIATFDPGISATDLALGWDDVLYIAFRQTAPDRSWIGLLDRRDRWTVPRIHEVELAGFRCDRLAAEPSGGVWVLDRTARALARLQGLPLRDGQPGVFREDVFRPVPENPSQPRLERIPIQPSLEAGEQTVALAVNSRGEVALLTWLQAGTRLHLRQPGGRWRSPVQLLEAGQPVSLTWMSPDRIAVIPSARVVDGVTRMPREALAYTVSDGGDALAPAGGFLPLRQLDTGVFAQGAGTPPHYPGPSRGLLPLLGLSVTAFERTGQATGRVLDGLVERITWHRIYLEGIFPPGCRAVLSVAATDEPGATPPDGEWHPHWFGEEPADAVPPQERPAQGVWEPDRSELPAHEGLLGRDPERNRAGLFTALIQRPGCQVRALQGRYLHVRVTLEGTGHSTPEIAALRFYGGRFSYRDHYLPELYRETLFGADGRRPGPATGADFLDRFLGLFESVLTPLEDRVAAAHLWTDPQSAPEEALEWLGGWIGVAFEPGFPAGRRRAWLAAAHRLYQCRGTLAGLQLALEVATGGALIREWIEDREAFIPRGGGVTGGEILVIEDFRLRRTFATLLGTNLSVENDPLLPGLIVSGNSHVGDTLLLGDPERTEFLALFRHAFSDDPTERAAEETVVFRLFDQLAHRVTILVHDAVTPADFGLIRRIAGRESPAHVAIRVEQASRALLVGLSSLVDVDTYLAPALPAGTARLGSSRLGENDFIQALPSLDPRLGRDWRAT